MLHKLKESILDKNSETEKYTSNTQEVYEKALEKQIHFIFNLNKDEIWNEL